MAATPMPAATPLERLVFADPISVVVDADKIVDIEEDVDEAEEMEAEDEVEPLVSLDETMLYPFTYIASIVVGVGSVVIVVLHSPCGAPPVAVMNVTTSPAVTSDTHC